MEPVLGFVAGACLLGGAAFLVIGAIGLVRLPDFFTRIHATGVIDTMGIALTFAGLVILAGWTLPAVKLVLILCFMLLTGPTATHALAKAALHGRLDPLSSRPPESHSSRPPESHSSRPPESHSSRPPEPHSSRPPEPHSSRPPEPHSSRPPESHSSRPPESHSSRPPESHSSRPPEPPPSNT